MLANHVIFEDQGTEQRLSLVGATVLMAKQNLRRSLNIPYFSDGLVNGEVVALGYVLSGGDRLRFQKRFGVKGGDDQPFEKHEAKALVDFYDLVKIAAEVKSLGLSMEDSVDLAMLKVASWVVEAFGPPDDAQANMVIAEVSRLIESMVRQGESTKLPPYRFERIGDIWHIHFSVNGEIKKTDFKHTVGIGQMAQLLGRPDRLIPSVTLNGSDDIETLGLIASDNNRRSEPAHQGLSVEGLQRVYDGIMDRIKSANLNGEKRDEEAAELELERFETEIGKTEKDFEKYLNQKLDDRKLGKTLHRTVAANRQRFLKSLRSEKHKMKELADHLEMSVKAEGFGFAYRPTPPAPNWVL